MARKAEGRALKETGRFTEVWETEERRERRRVRGTEVETDLNKQGNAEGGSGMHERARGGKVLNKLARKTLWLQPGEGAANHPRGKKEKND